jgi:LacI family transcriptional regulator
VSKSKKHTIYDIAAEAGVSTATVSRVLNNSPKVDFSTRKMILDLFNKYQYKPKIIKNKNPSIGVLIDMEHYNNFCFSEYVTSLLEGVIEYTFKNNLGLQITPFERGSIHYAEDIAEFLMEKGISGAIFINPPEDSAYIKVLQEINFPYMVIGSSFSDQEINCLDIDNYQGITKAVDYLVAHGHKEIGFLSFKEPIYAHKQRFDAFLKALEKNAIEFNKSYLLSGELGKINHESGYAITTEFLVDNPEIPTAFICLNDDLATGAIRAIVDNGLNVPEDISVIGFDDYPASIFQLPKLTTIKSPLHKIGYDACQYIERWIKGRREYIRKLYPAELIIRDSCRQIS